MEFSDAAARRIPLRVRPNPLNEPYIRIKETRMGHFPPDGKGPAGEGGGR